MKKKDNINIAEILKDCPKGMKLYTPMYGEVELSRVGDDDLNYPIVVNNMQGGILGFIKDGHHTLGFPDSECLLFPSSKMRDWKRFFKRGDIVIKNGGGMAAVFDGWANDTYTEFNTTINLYCDNNTGEEEVCTTHLFRKATEEECKQFIEKVERILKGKYNPEALQVESVKPECPFKPFDKVLVRDNIEQEWSASMFSYYDPSEGNKFPYMCLTSYYHYCIPYEGNEHLLGTTDPYIEGGSE